MDQEHAGPGLLLRAVPARAGAHPGAAVIAGAPLSPTLASAAAASHAPFRVIASGRCRERNRCREPAGRRCGPSEKGNLSRSLPSAADPKMWHANCLSLVLGLGSDRTRLQTCEATVLCYRREEV